MRVFTTGAPRAPTLRGCGTPTASRHAVRRPSLPSPRHPLSGRGVPRTPHQWQQQHKWCGSASSSSAAAAGPSYTGCGPDDGTCILWLKHDLRLSDHPGLVGAAQRFTRIVPLYVFDPTLHRLDTEQDVRWLHGVLQELRAELRDNLGSDLIVMTGSPEAVVPEVASAECASLVLAETEVDFRWRERMEAVETALALEGVTLGVWSMPLYDCARYPSSFGELQAQSSGVFVMPAPGPIALPSFSAEDATFPDADTLVALAKDAGSDLPAPLMAVAARGAVDGCVSAFCDAAVLEEGFRSGGPVAPPTSSAETLAALERYFRCFQEDGEDDGAEGIDAMGACAASLDLPGAEGQSFNVLFRKHVAFGVVSPRMLMGSGEAFKRNTLLDSARMRALWRTPTANAAMRAAAQFDFAKSLHANLPGEGARSWRWRGVHCDFIEALPDGKRDGKGKGKGEGDAPAAVLVHGFGAFGAHWRGNAEALARQGYRVYCPTLPGYGRSEKAMARYTPELWAEYVRDFVLEVVRSPVVLAGNSIGGYISALAASQCREMVDGLVLVNTAGRLVAEGEDAGKDTEYPKKVDAGSKRKVNLGAEVASRALFAYLQRAVPGILSKAYPVVPSRADAALVDEITRASGDPGAFDVFKSVFYLPTPKTLNSLIDSFGKDVLVFQGAKDPLNDAEGRAKKMKALCGNVQVVLVDAGHCPHDEVPEEFNRAFHAFVTDSVVSEQLPV